MDDLSPPAALLRDLIRCRSVTPDEGGALTLLESRLSALGFSVRRETFSQPDTPDVENLYARLGEASPNLCFAGHTDVVPPGDEEHWTAPPFEGAVEDGMMIGRGAVDMKGGVACFVAAVAAHLTAGKPVPGSISLLITGDEEGPAINGTVAILNRLVEEGEQIDACVVGEPTNPERLGDAIKIGRRGSMSGTLTVTGIQGHSAYPHLADNPLRGLTAVCDALMREPYDHGTDDFQPTNLEVTSVDTGNPAFNVIPAMARAQFNVRFNETWTAETLKAEIERRVIEALGDEGLRPGKEGDLQAHIVWQKPPSPVFLTRDEPLIDALSGAVEAHTGRKPELSTGGGTSDARFIKDVCPVVEFGLVGQTMHQVDERVALADLDALTAIYGAFIERYFDGTAA